ncbi:unnamed protein product [Protopolystoma xenopodis]|uniref:Secreted protein n=1 Tax=Protopolystoma xenopodis TaxID=117903 RepID=A0A448XNA8_9PLAT|nr:unnamed protein product [Protopolystoma xenopodis]
MLLFWFFCSFSCLVKSRPPVLLNPIPAFPSDDFCKPVKPLASGAFSISAACHVDTTSTAKNSTDRAASSCLLNSAALATAFTTSEGQQAWHEVASWLAGLAARQTSNLMDMNPEESIVRIPAAVSEAILFR